MIGAFVHLVNGPADGTTAPIPCREDGHLPMEVEVPVVITILDQIEGEIRRVVFHTYDWEHGVTYYHRGPNLTERPA